VLVPRPRRCRLCDAVAEFGVFCGQDVVDGTDHNPVLLLTGVVSGRYVFTLEVTDESGQKSSSTASVLVKSGRSRFPTYGAARE